MAFELECFGVRGLVIGKHTAFEGGVLSVDGGALAARLIEADARLADVRVHVARPGDSTRIACVKDVVEPRLKPSGERIGEGRTTALTGMAVATCGQIVGFQEGLIDMSGPGARHGPFSRLNLLVLELEPAKGLAPHAHEAALREAGLRAAEFVARAAAQVEPDRVERIELAPTPPALPRVAYLYMLLSQGLLHDTWVASRNAREGLPMRVDPAFVLDGGIVSGNCVSACDKNTTWHHQNNALIRELLRRHGRELNFAGVVLTNEPTRLSEKQRSADAAIALVRELEPAGVLISKEGFGNPDADQMMLIRGLERAGIRTVALTDEYAGEHGASQSLADTTPEADAMVSVGNANERIELPRMERVLGPADAIARIAGAYADSRQPDGALRVELQTIVGATNQLGEGRLSCVET